MSDELRRLVTVKPLEWDMSDTAKGGGAEYVVYETRPGHWNCVCYPHSGSRYRLAEGVYPAAAKSAAQADYEARIFAALTPTPHPTPADGGKGAK